MVITNITVSNVLQRIRKSRNSAWASEKTSRKNNAV